MWLSHAWQLGNLERVWCVWHRVDERVWCVWHRVLFLMQHAAKYCDMVQHLVWRDDPNLWRGALKFAQSSAREDCAWHDELCFSWGLCMSKCWRTICVARGSCTTSGSHILWCMRNALTCSDRWAHHTNRATDRTGKLFIQLVRRIHLYTGKVVIRSVRQVHLYNKSSCHTPGWVDGLIRVQCRAMSQEA